MHARRRFPKVPPHTLVPRSGSRALSLEPGGCPVGLDPKEDLLQSQVIVFLGQKLVECDVGVHGPHVLSQGGFGGLWKSSGSVMGGGHSPHATHCSLALTLPTLGGLGGGTQCTWVRDRERSVSPIFHVHPWGTGPRMEKGILLCLLHPGTAHSWGVGPGLGTVNIGSTVGGVIPPTFLAYSPWHCPSP